MTNNFFQQNPHFTCVDLSDRIFTINQTCTEEKYVEIYNETVCSGKYDISISRYDYCDRLEDIMRDHNTTEYWDPHNCRESCNDPHYGCLACTNPAYIHCTQNNISVCIHPDLKCNHHPDCDNAVDEQLDQCYDEYVKRGLVEDFATLRCQSKIYPIMETVATVCDDVVECNSNEDEPIMCKKKNSNTVLGISVGIILFIYLGLKFYSHYKRDTKKEQKKKIVEFMMNTSDIRILREKFRNFGLHVEHHFGKKTKRKVGLRIFALEAKEQNTEADIFSRLKNHYHPEIAKFVIESKFPGLVAKYLPFIQNILHHLSSFLDKFHGLSLLARKSLNIISHYIDTFKDVYILYLMVIINGGPGTLVDYPSKFSTIVIMCMATTVFCPLLLSSIQLAINNPGLIFNSKRTDKMSVGLMRGSVILLSVLIPILLNVAHENVNEDIRKESKKSEGSYRLTDLMRKKKEIKTELSRFTKVDLGIELIYQISIQLLLVLLNETKTPTTGGLEVLFEQISAFGMNATTLLILSTSWSFKTCILLQRKAIKTEKGLLPFTSTLLIVFWSTMAAGRRIMAIIVLFLPSLGLFNILNHWKAEQIPFAIRLEVVEDFNITSGDIIQLNGMTRSVPWTAIDRWEYKQNWMMGIQSDLKYHQPPPLFTLHWTGSWTHIGCLLGSDGSPLFSNHSCKDQDSSEHQKGKLVQCVCP